MRLFIGIDLPEKVKDDIYKKVIKKLESKYKHIKWERKEKLHITLRFLGRCKASRIEDISSALKKSVEGIEEFYIEIRHIDYFLSASFIVFASVHCECDKLFEVFKRIQNELAKIGFEKEKK